MRDRFPGGENINLLFNSDNSEPSVKTNGERGRRPNFIFGSLECSNCQLVGGGGLAGRGAPIFYIGICGLYFWVV